MNTRLPLHFPSHRPLFWPDLSLPPSTDVVVLAPHPDDFDAIGVTLRRLHQQGHNLSLAVLTSGANGIEDGWNEMHDARTKAAWREEEQRASCEFFGLAPDRLSFLRLWEAPHDEAADSLDLARLRDYLMARRPQLVFLPHGNDSNRTHRRTYESFRQIALTEKLALLACMNLDAKTLTMREDLYTCFGEEEAQWKARLLRFHRSQQERNLKSRGMGFDERVLQVNRDAAVKGGSGLPYAEVFELQIFD